MSKDDINDAVNDAEEINDPHEGLVERTKADPGAAFAPDVVERLAELKKEDRAAFEKLRAALKKAGCRVTALDGAIAEESGELGGRGPTQADILIDLSRSADLFHTPDSVAFADIDVNGHRETLPVRMKGFRRWLARIFFEATGGAPSSEALQSALNAIEAKAHFDAPERMVYVRVGGFDDRIYIDLADEKWRAIEVDAAGWRVIANPPVRFRRSAGMLPLPEPKAGGSIDALRPLINVSEESGFILLVAWLLAALRPRGPYPVLDLAGEHGTAKSSLVRTLRSLVDPNTAELRALPRSDRDLFIAASNGHVLAFDNVSNLPPWISDTLCRLATGGGFATRQLYSDQDETLFGAMRPVVLNGIEDVVTRPDLADRSIFLTLEPIPDDDRRPEAELKKELDEARPGIFGALLDALAVGIKRLPQTRLDRLPRMADFATWVTACETALWPAGTFMKAYCENRDAATETVLEADVVASAVRSLMARTSEWRGTAKYLLDRLKWFAGDDAARQRNWPQTPSILANRLRRAAPSLRTIGIEISFEREGHEGKRIVRITGDEASSSASTKPGNGSDGSEARMSFADKIASALAWRFDDADGSADGAVSANPLKSNGADGADAADGEMHTQSGPENVGTAAGTGRAAGRPLH
jgi:hypothetical protein